MKDEVRNSMNELSEMVSGYYHNFIGQGISKRIARKMAIDFVLGIIRMNMENTEKALANISMMRGNYGGKAD